MTNTIKRPKNKNNLFFIFLLSNILTVFLSVTTIYSNDRTMGEYAVAQTESWIQTCVLGSEPAHARLHHMQFQCILVLTIYI